LRKGELVSLLQIHGQELYTLLLRLTLCADAADDLLQDLFVKLTDSDALLNAAQPYAYLRRAAINLAFDWRRRKQRRAKQERCDELIEESIDRQAPA
jgi:DNA-directed RNA polymerase specialized sigma24 family protein